MIAPLLLAITCLFQTDSPGGGSSEPCPTCAGQGVLEQTCAPCQGLRKRPCKVCAEAAFLETRLKWAAPSSRQSLESELALEREKLARDGASDGGPRKRGYRDCSSKTCLRGTIEGTEQICAYCDGTGQVQCWRCKSTGQVGCPYCQGQGRAVSACLDCAGAGQLPVPHSKDASICPWCSGKKTRSCPKTSEVLPCTWCLGKFKAACQWCVGLRKVICERCEGARSSKNEAGQLERCEACNGKGFLRCSHCERGVVACEDCIGLGTCEQPCRACQGSGEVACSGCADGGYRAWDVTGDVLAALGDRTGERSYSAAASEFYQVAIERCRQFFAKDPGLAERQAAELQRLEARAAAVRE